jgi:KDO2-lipid IV(A) lauroyltransferase
MQLKNPEIFQDLYDKSKSVVIMSAHYANWEFFITAQNLIIPHRAIGIGKPLSEKFLNRKINALRERNGMKVVSADNYKEEIAFRHAMGEKMAILALADQAPKPESAYWTRFFNVETPFSFGAEYIAHQFDFAVVFVNIKKIKRGYYEAEAELITETAKKENYAAISDKYVYLLEKQIKEKAEDWLWTHKRWKHAIPNNLEEQKQQHRDFFNQRFSEKSE